MTNIPSTTDRRDTRRRAMQLLFAGAAAAATLALFGAGEPGDSAASFAAPHVSIGGGGAGGVKAINDDDVNNPSSGDIFTQNAQDQSTADGAGTT